jgi:hypothetical protein
MEQNKVRTYLLYAVGEIALVMIGILLALQVNNWNEAQTLQKLEIETLSEIQQALSQDIEILNENLLELDEKGQTARDLINHVENQKPYSDEIGRSMLDVYYHRGYKTFNTAAFELLKQRGFGIIQNDELRKQITNYYTTSLADINSILNRLENLNLLQAENAFKHYKIYSYEEKSYMRPYDYGEVLADPKVFGPFYHFNTMIRTYHGNLTSFKQKSEVVLEAVNTELKERVKAQ